MSRNGAGTYSLPEPPFVPNTPISSSAVNSDFSDIASALTGSVAADGQTPITGPLKGSNGSVGLPGYSFNSDLNTGMYRASSDVLGFAAGGSSIVRISPTGVDISGTLTVSGTGYIPTASIADEAVTYIKIQRPSAASRLLGSSAVAGKTITGAANNGAGLIRIAVADTSTLTTGQTKTVVEVVGTTEANGTWVITVIDSTHVDLQGSTFTNAYVSGGILGGSVSEISLGTGLALSNSGVLSAPAFPPAGVFTGLSIKVASTTTVTVAATAIVTTDGTNYQTTVLSGTINLGTNGAANALDAGTIATNTWYAIWAIAKSDGTTAGLASISATSPTLPAGYTYKARIGWVRTINASATLYGTWQFGRQARYIVGLAQTTVLPKMDGGIRGTYSVTAPAWQSISTSSFVPSTASSIAIGINTNAASAGSSNVQVAASNSYGGYGASGGNFPPFDSVVANQCNNFSMMLESANIYWASNGAGGWIVCSGWEDNI